MSDGTADPNLHARRAQALTTALAGIAREHAPDEGRACWANHRWCRCGAEVRVFPNDGFPVHRAECEVEFLRNHLADFAEELGMNALTRTVDYGNAPMPPTKIRQVRYVTAWENVAVFEHPDAAADKRGRPR